MKLIKWSTPNTILNLLLNCIVFGLCLLPRHVNAQNTDTLNVYVLSPYKIDIAANCLQEYAQYEDDIVKKRNELKKQKVTLKTEQPEEYAQLADDAKRMFDHELAFCDSLRINNYISFLVRDYMYYRLYKPFKIKPRLVWVTSATLPSDPKQYETFLSGRKNTFIINLPSVKIYHANQELRVETVIELYSGATQSVLLSEKTVGTPQTEITDYPLCSGNGWDCAFVNSVYPHFYSILRLIVEQQTTKK